MEILELYNDNNQPSGKTIVRGEKNIPDGLKVLLSTIWIKNDNKYLLQKCSVQKGGEYAVTGGHVPLGQTSRSQASIEAKEELGIDIKDSDLSYLGCIMTPRAIFDAYLYTNTVDISLIALQQEEVESVFWATDEDIATMIDLGTIRKSTEMQYKKLLTCNT